MNIIFVLIANSVDPDEMQHYVSFHLRQSTVKPIFSGHSIKTQNMCFKADN